jgi:tight adherence protein B
MAALLTVLFAVFLLTGFAVVVGWLLLERRGDAEGLVDSEVDLMLPGLLKRDDLSSISLWSRVLERLDVAERARRHLMQAGMNVSVGRLSAMMLLAAASAFSVFNSLAPNSWLLNVAAGLGAGAIPYWAVLRRRRKRLARFEDQFPDALDFLARALRAGHPFPVALEFLANESAAPLSVEMRITSDERRLGMSWDDAFRNLSQRVPLLNVRLFAAAVTLQTRTGGKLSEVLGQLAETMREAASLRGEVRAISAHGRMTGTILTVMPIAICFLMTSVNPGYLNVLLHHPLGPPLILASIGCLVLAHLVIRRIVDVRL